MCICFAGIVIGAASADAAAHAVRPTNVKTTARIESSSRNARQFIGPDLSEI
jgi:hypothetical protein